MLSRQDLISSAQIYDKIFDYLNTMAYVGEIYALGAQLEFFEVNDLMGAKEKLRYW